MMPIEAILFDLDGTLLSEADGSRAAGVPEMLEHLESRGLRWAALTNRAKKRGLTRLAKAGLEPDLFLSRSDVGMSKPSPRWCEVAASSFGVTKSQLVYVGDTDETDGFCAINAKVLYVNAGWSNPTSRYGLQAQDPGALCCLVDNFLLRQPRWDFAADGVDRLKRPFTVRTLFDARSLDTADYKHILAVLKTDQQGNYEMRLFIYFLTSLYLSGLYETVDLWTNYPSSSPRTERRRVRMFLGFCTKLFHDYYLDDLIIRHKPAEKLAYARRRHVEPPFANQVNTVHLNPAYRTKLQGKHVLVVDDFWTRSKSFECARNLLYLGGAGRVTCVSFGRFGDFYSLRTLRSGKAWDPWKPAALSDTDFDTATKAGTTDPEALGEFKKVLAADRA